MNSKLLIRKTLSTFLAVAVVAACSMSTLAGSDKIAGEIVVSGKAVNGQNPFVKINGDEVQNSRAIFSGSTIATPENVRAVVNLGKAGKIELAPNTTFSLSFDEKSINGELASGRITVLDASETVAVKTDGGTTELAVGESADATAGKSQTSGGGSGWVIFAVVLGGAAAAIIFTAVSDNNRIALGGGSTVVSTTR